MDLVAQSVKCPLCKGQRARLVERLQCKPAAETDFGIPHDAYQREIMQCASCSVFFSRHDLLNGRFYNSQYNDATYQRDLASTYRRIRGLPESASDNKQRVRRVVEFHAACGKRAENATVLDVGTGLCVFLAEMQDRGYRCHAIDPDPVAAAHARDHVGVAYAHAGTLDDYPLTDVRYDVISFNKVLEHVPDPIAVLKLAKRFLKDDGFVYLELPDGESALERATVCDREEFYIEHETIFTNRAMRYLVEHSKLRIKELARLHEPSDKFTIYAFCSTT